jgi:hypothetical protein
MHRREINNAGYGERPWTLYKLREEPGELPPMIALRERVDARNERLGCLAGFAPTSDFWMATQKQDLLAGTSRVLLHRFLSRILSGTVISDVITPKTIFIWQVDLSFFSK